MLHKNAPLYSGRGILLIVGGLFCCSSRGTAGQLIELTSGHALDNPLYCGYTLILRGVCDVSSRWCNGYHEIFLLIEVDGSSTRTVDLIH